MIARALIAFIAATGALATGLAAGGVHSARLLADAGLPWFAAMLVDDPAWRGVALLKTGDASAAAEVLRTTRSPEAAYNLGNALALSGDLEGALKAYDLALIRDPDDGDAKANRALVATALAEGRGPGSDEARGGLANSGGRIDHRSGADDTSDDETRAISAIGDGMVGGREGRSDNTAAGAGTVDRKGSGQQDESEAGAGSSTGAATDAAGRAGKGGGPTESAASDAPDPRRALEIRQQEELQATLQWVAAIPDDPARYLKLKIDAERLRRFKTGTAVSPGGDPW